MQRQQRTGRERVQKRRATRFVDERREVLDLTLDRVWRGVAAVASSAAVVVIDREVGRERTDQPAERAEPAVVSGGVDQDQRRPGSGSLERDFRPVPRTGREATAHAVIPPMSSFAISSGR